MMTNFLIMVSLSNMTNDIKYTIAENKIALTSSMEATDDKENKVSI